MRRRPQHSHGFESLLLVLVAIAVIGFLASPQVGVIDLGALKARVTGESETTAAPKKERYYNPVFREVSANARKLSQGAPQEVQDRLSPYEQGTNGKINTTSAAISGESSCFMWQSFLADVREQLADARNSKPGDALYEWYQQHKGDDKEIVAKVKKHCG